MQKCVRYSRKWDIINVGLLEYISRAKNKLGYLNGLVSLTKELLQCFYMLKYGSNFGHLYEE